MSKLIVSLLIGFGLAPCALADIEYTFTANWTANYDPYPSSNVSFSFQLILPTFVTTDGYAAASVLTSCSVTGTEQGVPPAVVSTPCEWVGLLPSGPGDSANHPEIDVAYSWAYDGSYGGGDNAFYFPFNSFFALGEYDDVYTSTNVPGFYGHLTVSDVQTPPTAPVVLTPNPPPLSPGGVVATPEPGFYGVFTVCMAGVLFAVRRRKSNP
jgi:hypothetical protein